MKKNWLLIVLGVLIVVLLIMIWAVYGKEQSQSSAATITTSTTPINFTDVPADYWAYNAIQEVAKAGYMTGYKDGTFKPGEKVNRAQLAVVFSRIAGLDVTTTPATQSFTDVARDFWAFKEIEAVNRAGIMQGYTSSTGNQFKPLDTATKAQVAVIIYRMINNSQVRTVSVSGFPTFFKYEIFKDANSSYWAYRELLAMYHSAYMPACKVEKDGVSICPEESVDRAHLAVYIKLPFVKTSPENPTEGTCTTKAGCACLIPVDPTIEPATCLIKRK